MARGYKSTASKWTDKQWRRSYNAYLNRRSRLSGRRKLGSAMSYGTYKNTYLSVLRSHPSSSILSNMPSYFANSDIMVSAAQARAWSRLLGEYGFTYADFLLGADEIWDLVRQINAEGGDGFEEVFYGDALEKYLEEKLQDQQSETQEDMGNEEGGDGEQMSIFDFI